MLINDSYCYSLMSKNDYLHGDLEGKVYMRLSLSFQYSTAKGKCTISKKLFTVS